MKKAFFFDIDSTSYLHSIKDNPESTKLAFQLLKRAGHSLFICTSRAKEEMIELPKAFLSMMDGIVCAGGAMLIVDDRIVSYHILDENEVKKGIAYFDQKGLAYRYNTVDGRCYLNKHHPDSAPIFQRLYDMIPQQKTYQDETIIHLLYYSKDHQEKEDIYSIFTMAEHVNMGWANEIAAKRIDKATGMLEMANYFGFTRQDCVAFGDAENDISMLQRAMIGIAMGNAKEAVKKIADYVTDSIEKDGLYKACIHYGWIEENTR